FRSQRPARDRHRRPFQSGARLAPPSVCRALAPRRRSQVVVKRYMLVEVRDLPEPSRCAEPECDGIADQQLTIHSSNGMEKLRTALCYEHLTERLGWHGDR